MTPLFQTTDAYPGRFPCREVRIGNTWLGPEHPVSLQSMSSTATTNVKATSDQCIRLFEAGADYMRIGIPNKQTLSCVPEIKRKIRAAGFDNPLIADIHFSAELGLAAAPLFEKIRINPGNYADKPLPDQKEWTEKAYRQALEQIYLKLEPLVKVCKAHGTAIRIGSNFGSLSQRIIWHYGYTPEALVVSTLEFLRILEDLGFYQTVVSLKASDPLLCVQSYHLMARRMLEEKMAYPMHLGITEAGDGEDARIKSSLGISTLLQMGIGDTIRVSLSEEPEAEIPVARAIVKQTHAKSFQALADSAYHLPSFQVRPNCDILPGSHKAIIIDHVSNQTDKEAEDIFYAIACRQWNRQMQADTFPLFTREEVTADGIGFHPTTNLLMLTEMPSISFLRQLRHIPGLLLLTDFGKERTTGNMEELHRRTADSGLKTCCLIKVPLNKEPTENPGISSAAELGTLLLQRLISGVWLEQDMDIREKHKLTSTLSDLLHLSGLRINRTSFISCPSCTRTSFDLQKVLREVKEQTNDLPGIKIAVMGCVVNGPGEMRGADYGILGSAPGKVNLYKGERPVKKNIKQENAAAELLALLKSEGLC